MTPTLRAWQVEQAVARFTPAQVDELIRNARTDATHALYTGDAVWRRAAPSATEMLAIIDRIDRLELG